MASIKVKFGKEVRKQREKLGLSQEKFAEIAGVHRTYVSSIELGKVDVSLTVASKVAKTLNMKLSRLITSIE